MTRTRTLRAAVLLSAFLAIALPSAASTASAATDTSDGASWSLIPAENANGAGRGNYGYAVDPGAVVADALVVTNTGADPLDLALYAADAFTTAEGVLDLRLADDPKVDSGSWIALEAKTITLQPGEVREVGFTITVPADARPGDHPGGIITSLTSAEAGSTLAVDRRLGIRVHLRVSGELDPKVEVTDAAASFDPSWNPFSGGALKITYTLTNTGDTRITAADALALAGPLGIGAVAGSPQPTAEVLPGSSIEVERIIDGVAPLGWLGGTLTIVPEAVGIGAQALEPISVEVSAVTISWTLLALIVVLVLVALTVVLLVLRRRARQVADAGARA